MTKLTAQEITALQKPPPENRLEERMVALRERMTAQHPLHGMFANVFENLGGEAALLEWAEDNPAQFFAMFTKLAPAAIPKGTTGAVHLHVHSDLAPTALDRGIVIDNDPQGTED
jgi:hypothetical protein